MEKFLISQKALVVSEGKLLILKKEKKGLIYLDFPGGRIAEGGSQMEALKRELSEELIGIDLNQIVINQDPLYVYEMPQELIKADVRMLVIFYKVDYQGNIDSLRISDEHLNMSLVNLDSEKAFENLEVLDGYMEAIKNYRKVGR
ncbi:NUDIX hydrolase [Candidatus Dojkabacteria bacterium]|nr:NUDIX hydrolase [Candidatus Dojkabacteria bacterium]